MDIERKFTSLLFLSLLCSFASFAQIKKGDTAPRIVFEKSFPENYVAPKGKPILLDFWATWCTPCVAALKESNAFVENYRDKIEFLCITDSSSKNMEEFIRKNNFRHQFLLNANQSTQRSYKVRGLPTAFLIDAKGIVQWSGSALDVTTALLDEFITTGKTTGEQPSRTISFSTINVGSSDFSFDFKEIETTGTNTFPLVMMGAKGDSISYSIRNTSLRRIIELLFDDQTEQILFRLNDPQRLEKRFTLNVFARKVDLSTINFSILNLIADREKFAYSLQQIDTTAGVFKTIDKEKFRLKRTPLDPIKGKVEEPVFQIEEDSTGKVLLTAVNFKLAELQATASRYFKSLIVFPDQDDSGYDFENIRLDNPGVFETQMSDEYGLILKKEKATIPFLLIEER